MPETKPTPVFLTAREAQAKLRIEHEPQGRSSEEPGGPVTLPGEPFTWPAGLRVEVPLVDCPPFRGDNELGIALKRRSDPAGKDPVMEALEVRVTE